MNQIVWLASYPKSGNTWLRLFLANFLRNSRTPIDINDIGFRAVASNRRMADEAMGVECSDMTADEIDGYRPALYRHLAMTSEAPLYLKIHDAHTGTTDGQPLIPSDVSRAVVYVVRNPLDVAVSFAHHSSKTIDEIIERMACDTAALAGHCDRLHFQLRQRLLAWSHHVESWLDQSFIPVRVMRYEDTCRDPVEAFSSAIHFLGLERNPERIRRAVQFSSFDSLRCQESEKGFKEKPFGAASFFRFGKPGAWREILTDRQVDRVIADHGEVMRRLGYLDQTQSTDLR